MDFRESCRFAIFKAGDLHKTTAAEAVSKNNFRRSFKFSKDHREQCVASDGICFEEDNI
jgi:hypothetical protein